MLTFGKWEWHNNYSPAPEIYNQLWHIRQEPVDLRRSPQPKCPLPDARSRILDRRQTEGDIQRNFYVVEVTNFPSHKTSVSSAEDAGLNATELFHVDLSRILDYVSPAELERFENEQFQIEAEAEAVAMRVEAEELRRRRLEKNARSAAMGQGSRMLSGLGLGLDPDMRPRGRPRGRGRGRGRGSWRGRGALVLNGREQDMRDQLVDAEGDELVQTEDGLQMMIDETDSEDVDLAAELEARTSPNLARSAFVANSALSPVLSHRRPSGTLSMPRIPIDALDDQDEESDLELLDRDARSMLSAAMQLRIESDINTRSETTLEDGGGHRGKRRRTESTASNQRPHPRSPFSSTIPESPVSAEHSDDAIPAHEPIAVHRGLQNGNSNGAELDNIHVQSPTVGASIEEQSDGDNEDEDAEEYVVEAIIEHYRDAGKKFYLVKWQGYEDSHDWLPEEDLEGAAELVAEYNEKVHRRKMKGKQKMTM